MKTGALLSYFSIGFNILAGLLYTPWMINQIGQAQYGLYTLVNSVITLFMIDFGLSSATSRYVAKLHAEGDEDGVSNFLGLVYKLYIIIDLLMLLGLVLVYFYIDEIYVKLTPNELRQFKTVYLIAASYSIIQFPFVTLNGIYIGYEKFAQLKIAELVQRVLTVGLTIVALVMGLGLYAIVTVNALAGLAMIGYKIIVLCKKTTVKVNFHYFDRTMLNEIFNFSVWSTVAALSQRLIFNVMPSILGVLSSSASIAVFGVIATLESHVFTITNAINGMFVPRVARIYSQNSGNQDILPLMLKVGRFQYALSGLIVVGFAIVGKDFISLWMGPLYMDAYLGVLLVIVPGMFFSSLQIGHTAIIITKHVHLYAYINLLVGVLNVVLAFFLIQRYDVIGACLSVFVVYTIRALLLNLLYKHKLHIDMKTFAKKCYLQMSVPIVAAMLISPILCAQVPWDGWIGLCVKAIIISFIYAVFLFAAGFVDRKLQH